MYKDGLHSKRYSILLLLLVITFTTRISAQSAITKPVEVSPLEDLMREHGLLNRLLLIYEDILKKLDHGKPARMDILTQAAEIISTFIEGYHEKLEEEHLFPLFEKAHKMTDLVRTLKEQHNAGRQLTVNIKTCASSKKLTNAGKRRLAESIRQFVHMYRVHEAREDTVLFPEVHMLVSPKDYEALGDTFETKEEELFGKDGFKTLVDKVAVLEKELSIYNLEKFTPKITKKPITKRKLRRNHGLHITGTC